MAESQDQETDRRGLGHAPPPLALWGKFLKADKRWLSWLFNKMEAPQEHKLCIFTTVSLIPTTLPGKEHLGNLCGISRFIWEYMSSACCMSSFCSGNYPTAENDCLSWFPIAPDPGAWIEASTNIYEFECIRTETRPHPVAASSVPSWWTAEGLQGTERKAQHDWVTSTLLASGSLLLGFPSCGVVVLDIPAPPPQCPP